MPPAPQGRTALTPSGRAVPNESTPSLPEPTPFSNEDIGVFTTKPHFGIKSTNMKTRLGGEDNSIRENSYKGH